MPTTHLLPPGPDGDAVYRALSACVLLTQAGCGLRSAHCHDGIPVIVVDRRPLIVGLTPRLARRDAHWCDYDACVGGIQVAWTERRIRGQRQEAA